MALPIIANVYRSALQWHDSSSGGDAVNVMHWSKAGSDEGALYTALNSHVTQSMWGAVNSGCHVVTVTNTKLDGTTASADHATGEPAKWQGGGGSNGSIPQQACLLKLTTALRGRSYRGRIYLPFIDESQTSSGKITTGTVTSMATAWATFLTDMGTDGWTLVVASYLHSTAQAVTGLTVESESATQRRRMSRLR